MVVERAGFLKTELSVFSCITVVLDGASTCYSCTNIKLEKKTKLFFRCESEISIFVDIL